MYTLWQSRDGEGNENKTCNHPDFTKALMLQNMRRCSLISGRSGRKRRVVFSEPIRQWQQDHLTATLASTLNANVMYYDEEETGVQ